MDITTKKLEDGFLDLVETFVECFKKKDLSDVDEYHDVYKVILMKIASNLLSANILWAKGRFDDSKVIIRSGFESAVLLSYLIAFPNEISRYLLESEISSFNNHVKYLIRGYSNYEAIGSHLSSLSENARKEILANQTSSQLLVFDQKKVEAFIQKWKPLPQQVRDMKKQLNEQNCDSYKFIEIGFFPIYMLNSEIVHGTWETLARTYIKTSLSGSEDQLDHVKECYRESVLILTIAATAIKSLVKEDIFTPSYKKILSMYEFLGYKIPNQEPVKNTSNLIEIIRNTDSVFDQLFHV